MKVLVKCFLCMVTLISLPVYAENSYQESQSNIVVTVKEPYFAIKMRTNPSTGYSWRLLPYNTKIIQPLSHRILPPLSQLVGASSQEEWHFKVNTKLLTKKNMELKFVYERPWEKTLTGKVVVFKILYK